MGDGGEPGNTDHHFPVVARHTTCGRVVSTDKNSNAADNLKVTQSHDELPDVRVASVNIDTSIVWELGRKIGLYLDEDFTPDTIT